MLFISFGEYLDDLLVEGGSAMVNLDVEVLPIS